MSMKAVNRAGMTTSVFSKPFVFDTSPPSPGIVDDGEDASVVCEINQSKCSMLYIGEIPNIATILLLNQKVNICSF